MDDTDIYFSNAVNRQNMTDPDTTRIGGWLIIIGIGLFLNPLFLLGNVIRNDFPRIDLVDTFSNPASPEYIPNISQFLYFEFLGNISFVILAFFLVYNFYAQKSLFPKFFITVIVLNLVFILFDIAWSTSVFPELEVFDVETTRQLILQVVTCVVWVPYMLFSKRVKKTFVRL